ARYLVAGEAELDVEPLPVGLYQARGAQDLQGLRGIRHREPRLPGGGPDGPRALAEESDELQAPRAGGRLAEPRQQLVDRVLEPPLVSQGFNCSLELWIGSRACFPAAASSPAGELGARDPPVDRVPDEPGRDEGEAGGDDPRLDPDR